MSDDRFILKDTNGDGIPDIVVVERVDRAAKAKAAAYTAQHAAYYRYVENARAKAARDSAGQSAVQITAAGNVAVARAKASWKGPTPPVSKADVEVAAAEKEAAEVKAAVKEEIEKLQKV